MNDPVITEFLHLNTTPELVAVLEDANTVFELFEMQDVEYGMLQLILGRGSEEENITLLKVVDQFKAKLEYLLRLHGIEMNSDYDMTVAIGICKALAGYIDYEDTDALIDICDGDDQPLDKLAEIVGMLGTTITENVFINVASVTDTLIDRMRNILKQSEEDVFPVNQEAVDRFNHYRETIVPAEVSYTAMIEAGMPIGMDFKTYLNLYMQTLRTLDLSQGEKLSMVMTDLVGLCLLSFDKNGDIVTCLREVISGLTDDLKITNRADLLVKDIMKKYTHVKN